MLVVDPIQSSADGASARQSNWPRTNEAHRHAVEPNDGAVRYACPHCKAVAEDALDLLDTNELHQLRCEDCAGIFWLLVRECGHCTHEEAWTWVERPDAVSQLVASACAQCGRIDIEHDQGCDAESI